MRLVGLICCVFIVIENVQANEINREDDIFKEGEDDGVVRSRRSLNSEDFRGTEIDVREGQGSDRKLKEITVKSKPENCPGEVGSTGLVVEFGRSGRYVQYCKGCKGEVTNTISTSNGKYSKMPEHGVIAERISPNGKGRFYCTGPKTCGSTCGRNGTNCTGDAAYCARYGCGKKGSKCKCSYGKIEEYLEGVEGKVVKLNLCNWIIDKRRYKPVVRKWIIEGKQSNRRSLYIGTQSGNFKWVDDVEMKLIELRSMGGSAGVSLKNYKLVLTGPQWSRVCKTESNDFLIICSYSAVELSVGGSIRAVLMSSQGTIVESKQWDKMGKPYIIPAAWWEMPKIFSERHGLGALHHVYRAGWVTLFLVAIAVIPLIVKGFCFCFRCYAWGASGCYKGARCCRNTYHSRFVKDSWSRMRRGYNYMTKNEHHPVFNGHKVYHYGDDCLDDEYKRMIGHSSRKRWGHSEYGRDNVHGYISSNNRTRIVWPDWCHEVYAGMWTLLRDREGMLWRKNEQRNMVKVSEEDYKIWTKFKKFMEEYEEDEMEYRRDLWEDKGRTPGMADEVKIEEIDLEKERMGRTVNRGGRMGRSAFLLSLSMMMLGVMGQPPSPNPVNPYPSDYNSSWQDVNFSNWQKPRRDGTCDWAGVLKGGSVSVSNDLSSKSSNGASVTTRSVGWKNFEVTTLGVGSTACLRIADTESAAGGSGDDINMKITEVENERIFDLRLEYTTYEWRLAQKSIRICHGGDGSASGAANPSHSLCDDSNACTVNQYDTSARGVFNDVDLKYNGLTKCVRKPSGGWGQKPLCFDAAAQTCIYGRYGLAPKTGTRADIWKVYRPVNERRYHKFEYTVEDSEGKNLASGNFTMTSAYDKFKIGSTDVSDSNFRFQLEGSFEGDSLTKFPVEFAIMVNEETNDIKAGPAAIAGSPSKSMVGDIQHSGVFSDQCGSLPAPKEDVVCPWNNKESIYDTDMIRVDSSSSNKAIGYASDISGITWMKSKSEPSDPSQAWLSNSFMTPPFYYNTGLWGITKFEDGSFSMRGKYGGQQSSKILVSTTGKGVEMSINVQTGNIFATNSNSCPGQSEFPMDYTNRTSVRGCYNCSTGAVMYFDIKSTVDQVVYLSLFAKDEVTAYASLTAAIISAGVGSNSIGYKFEESLNVPNGLVDMITLEKNGVTLRTSFLKIKQGCGRYEVFFEASDANNLAEVIVAVHEDAPTTNVILKAIVGDLTGVDVVNNNYNWSYNISATCTSCEWDGATDGIGEWFEQLGKAILQMLNHIKCFFTLGLAQGCGTISFLWGLLEMFILTVLTVALVQLIRFFIVKEAINWAKAKDDDGRLIEPTFMTVVTYQWVSCSCGMCKSPRQRGVPPLRKIMKMARANKDKALAEKDL